MNMYLLVVAMCEKWRSSHFQSEGGEGVKKLRTGWSEFKHLRPGGGGELPIWGGGTFAGGVGTPLHVSGMNISGMNIYL